MLGIIKDQNLFMLLGIVGLLLFSSIGYGIYATVGLLIYKLSETINEYAKIHELIIEDGLKKS